ncbi:MAG: LptF/LptG family permease [Rhizomicrobium sp.]
MQIQESFAPPYTLSFWQLPSFIHAAQSAGFSAVRYELYFYTLLAMPALFAAMVFMAASFSVRLGRSGGMLRVVLISACPASASISQRVRARARPDRHPARGARGRRAGHGRDPDRHDPRLQPGGRMIPPRGLVLIAALAALTAAPASAAPALTVKGDVLLQADEMDYDVDAHVVTARGHVEIDSRTGRILLADQVSYDQAHDTMTASGHVSLTDERGNVAFANHVDLRDKMRDGALRSFAALIGKNGRMVAASATRSQGRFIEAFDASYTPCKICNQPGQRTPVWQVSAEHVRYDQLKHRIIFHDARLEFFGVPLFYTPYLRESDPTVRYSSGVLTPDIGNSTNIGYFLRLPSTFRCRPSRDATITPIISTRGGDVIAGEYRERWENGGMWLQGSVGYNPDGGLSGHQGQFYSSLFGSGRIPIDAVWRTGYDAQLTNNDTYLKRYDFSLLDRLVNDAFLEGTGGRTRFAVTGYFFQGLRATDTPGHHPPGAAAGGVQLHPAEQSAGQPVPLRLQHHRADAQCRRGRPARHDGGAHALADRAARRPAPDVPARRARRRLPRQRPDGARQQRQVHQPRDSLCRARLALAVHQQHRQGPLADPRADRAGDRTALWRQSRRHPGRGLRRLRTRREQHPLLRPASGLRLVESGRA